MRSVTEFVGEVLAGPMLIMFAIPPEPGSRQVINDAVISAPDFVTILAITQS
ncbi:hypothetical protein GCM10028818_28130 [Spirosoma horti]